MTTDRPTIYAHWMRVTGCAVICFAVWRESGIITAGAIGVVFVWLHMLHGFVEVLISTVEDLLAMMRAAAGGGSDGGE